MKIGISLISIDNNLLNLQKQTKKNMNKKSSILRIVLPTLLMLFTCLVNIQAKDHMVQRGMTKEQVMQILGKPDATKPSTPMETDGRTERVRCWIQMINSYTSVSGGMEK